MCRNWRNGNNKAKEKASALAEEMKFIQKGLVIDMKKLISICAVCSLILTMFGVLPVSAGNSALTEDFEAYAEYTNHGEFMAALKKLWPDSLEKDPDAKFEAVKVTDRMGEETTALRLSGAGTKLADPYIQTFANMDMDGDRVISFDVKVKDQESTLKVCYRDGNISPTGWFNIFEKWNGKTEVKSFNQVVSSQGAPYVFTPEVWHHVVVVTSFDGASETMTYSLYVDGEKLVDNATYNHAGAKYRNVQLRFTMSFVAGEKGKTEGYFDNIKIRPLSQAGFQEMTTVPAAGTTDADVAQNAVRFRFGTEIAPASFSAENVVVTEAVSGTETAITPVKAELSGDILRIQLKDGELASSADYTVTLPEGILDIHGNALPEEKRTLMFGTASDPGNQPPAVRIIAPADGTRIDPGSSVDLEIEASDPDGEVVNAIYYANGQEIGRSNRKPFSINWNGMQEGRYSLTCRVYDNGGARSNSEAVNLVVEKNKLPTAELKAPAEGAPGVPVTLEAAAADPNGESVQKVEFFVDYQKVGEATEAPFTFSWTPEKEGEYILSAKAYDAVGGGGYSKPVNFVAVKREATVLYQWDAEKFDGTEGSCPSGGRPVGNGTGTFSAVQLDAEHGKSAACHIDGKVGNNAPYFVVDFPEQKTGILTAEVELRMDTTEQIVECFTIRGNGSGGAVVWNTDMIISGGEIRANGPAAKLKEFKANQWYKLKLVYNLNAKKVDIYVDDVLMQSKGYQSGGLQGIPQIRFTHRSDADVQGTLYLDNLKISILDEPAKEQGISAKNAAGEILNQYKAEEISTIQVNFTKALSGGTVKAENVKLYKGYGQVELEAEVSCGSENKAVVIKPAVPLEDGSLYRVELSDAITDTSGTSIGRGRGGSIRTLAGECGVQNGSFLCAGETVESVMNLIPGEEVVFRAEGVSRQGAKSVWILTALYKGDTMENYALTKVTLEGEAPQAIESNGIRINGEITPEHSVRTMIWDAETGAALGEQFILK